MRTRRVLKEGDKAPKFTLPASTGGKISLKDFLGKKTVVLYFYPKDTTPGCTREACNFRDTAPAFESEDTVILGVSRDSVKSHENFIRKHSLPFPLLSDEDAAVSKAYGVYVSKKLYGKTSWGIERSTFVIGQDGRIKKIFRKVKVEGHAEEVMAAVRRVES